MDFDSRDYDDARDHTQRGSRSEREEIDIGRGRRGGSGDRDRDENWSHAEDRSMHPQPREAYHIHHRPLYHATGEPDSRFRRAVPARSAAEWLMRVDAALTDPTLEWLTTRSEKVPDLQARMGRGSRAVHERRA